MKYQCKASLASRSIVLLGITLVLIVGLYYWSGPIFYLLPALAAVLFLVVSAIAIVPELQQKVPKAIRILLVCVLLVVGITGEISNRFQHSKQENQADLETKQLLTQNKQLLNEVEGIRQSVNRLVADGRLSKVDAAKILSRVSHLHEGNQVRLNISFEGNENFLNAELMCLVTDPQNRSYWSGPLASGSVITGLGLSVSYPSFFHGAPHLRPGMYSVTWIMAADSKQVIATDSFEILTQR